MTFDLTQLDTVVASNKGADVELLHPKTKQGLGIFFNLLGSDSEELRELVKERIDARVRQQAVFARKGTTVPPETADQQEQKAIELLTVATKGWYTLESKAGKDNKLEVVRRETIPIFGTELEYSVANAKRVITEQLWIRNQIDVAIADIENFM